MCDRLVHCSEGAAQLELQVEPAQLELDLKGRYQHTPSQHTASVTQSVTASVTQSVTHNTANLSLDNTVSHTVVLITLSVTHTVIICGTHTVTYSVSICGTHTVTHSVTHLATHKAGGEHRAVIDGETGRERVTETATINVQRVSHCNRAPDGDADCCVNRLSLSVRLSLPEGATLGCTNLCAKQ